MVARPRSYKILMLCQAPPGRGGVGILAYLLARSLAMLGHQVLFVCPPFEGLSSEDYNIRIIPVLRRGLVTNFFVVLRLLLMESPDVIHAHRVFPVGLWAIVGKIFGIPIVVTSHGGDIQKDEEIGYGARLSKPVALLTWLVLKLIDKHVLVSKSMIADAVEAGSDLRKIRVIYNGIDPKIVPFAMQTDILQRYGISNDDFVILYLGRLHPKKRPEDLIKAFPRVLEEIPNAKLIFAGKGEEESRLRKMSVNCGLKGKVIFLGFVTEDEKWRLFRRCDVFVLPSIVEGCPLSVLEAMACGKPVVVTRIRPFLEIVKNGETGILVPPRSPERLADALINLARDPRRRRRMGERAKREVECRFAIDKVARRYLDVYRSAIEMSRR